MTILVQDYLRSGKTYEELLADHGVHAKPYNGKISLVYDQLQARDDDPLACQCRGLILDEETLDVIAYPFDRFFNHGQGAAANVDWVTARFEEKLDGTLIIAYWDPRAERWMCGTRSMCEAHGNINGTGTFAGLVDTWARGLARHGDEYAFNGFNDLMTEIDANKILTYMFELVGPYNQVVCEYSQLNLVSLGARNLNTFQEIDHEHSRHAHFFACPRLWEFANIDHLVEVMRGWSPVEYEGVVVKDANFNRIKVKTPQYLAIHHATDSLGSSWRNVCEAILRGHADDIVAKVPLIVRERIESLRPAIAKVVEIAERDMIELQSIEDIKPFALEAQKRIWPAALFAVKRGKTGSISEFASQAKPEGMLEMCRLVGWKEP